MATVVVVLLVAAGIGVALGRSTDPVADPSAAAVSATPPVPDTGWTGSWATGVTEADPATRGAGGFEDTTLRQTVRLSVGGDAVRLRLTNAYGTSPLQVGGVVVSTGGRDEVRVTFAGAGTAVVEPGTQLVSDPVPLRVADRGELTIDTFLPEPTGPATVHPYAGTRSYLAEGDATGGDGFTALDTSWYYLAGVDVPEASASGAVVFLGDSITDGFPGTVDGDTRYPDRVAERLVEPGAPERLGVLNVGISANRVLAGGEDDAGESALDRFTRDVLTQPGVRTVVLLEGINDIAAAGGALDPRELSDAYAELVRRAHARGIRVVGATLPPFGGSTVYTDAGEEDRLAVNATVRAPGWFDAVLDVDEVLRNPDYATAMLPVYDSGDGLHPSDAGYRAMGDAVDLAVLAGGPGR